MNKGIVLKINSTSVIVLTPGGEYLKCKRLLSSYSIGEEIQFPNHAVIVNKKIKTFIPKLVPVMIASVLLFMSFLLVDWNKKRVLAAGYVNLDSGAKVSIIIDKDLKVIGLKAKNDQGKKVIKKMKDWKHESLNHVTDDLIVEMEKNDIIQHNEKITLTGSMEKKYKNEQKKLRKELKKIKQSNTHFNTKDSKEIEKSKEIKAEMSTYSSTGQTNSNKNNHNNDSKVSKEKKNKDNPKKNGPKREEQSLNGHKQHQNLERENKNKHDENGSKDHSKKNKLNDNKHFKKKENNRSKKRNTMQHRHRTVGSSKHGS